MTFFLSEELSDYKIFITRISGDYYAVEKKVWTEKYQYDERRFVNDGSLYFEVEKLVLEPSKKEYIKSGQRELILHTDLKSVLAPR